jgi:hypothetical protein
MNDERDLVQETNFHTLCSVRLVSHFHYATLFTEQYLATKNYLHTVVSSTKMQLVL